MSRSSRWTASRSKSSPAEGVLERLRLLVDLLQHEVLEAALFGLDRVPVQSLDLAVERLSLAVEDPRLVVGQPGQVAVFEEHHVLGVGQERRRVRGQELLAVADAQHQRRPLPGGHDLAPAARHGDGGEGVHPFELVDGRRHRREQGVFAFALEMGGDQVGHHLGVGVGREGPAFLAQLLLERQEVLDDAVVDHGARFRASNTGWAFLSDGGPWVAQRVWPRP
jgi:hypothetical protein